MLVSKEATREDLWLPSASMVTLGPFVMKDLIA